MMMAQRRYWSCISSMRAFTRAWRAASSKMRAARHRYASFERSSRSIPSAFNTYFSKTSSEVPVFILRMKYFSVAIFLAALMLVDHHEAARSAETFLRGDRVHALERRQHHGESERDLVLL